MGTTLTIQADDTTSLPTTYLEFDVDAVVTYVGTYLGGSPTSAVCLKHVLAGYQAVLAGMDPRARPPRRYFWNFMRPVSKMTLSATTTGTASGQGSYSDPSTTLTAAAATFDDSHIGHTLTFDTSEEGYVITAVTSSTVIVITGDASSEKSGDTFSIDAKGYHTPPTGFRGVIEEPVYSYSADGSRYDLIKESPETIRRRWRSELSSGYTRYWALEPIAFDETVGQTYQFLVAPVPSESMVLQIRTMLRVTDPAAGNKFIGGDIISCAVRDAAMADAELITGGVQGVWAAKAAVSLMAAIDADKETVTTNDDTERLLER